MPEVSSPWSDSSTGMCRDGQGKLREP
jgi:hypothetical protein